MDDSRAFEKLKPGFKYLQLALNAAFVVNGGALVALYPIAQWMPREALCVPAISAAFFVAGIFCAYRCAVAAFSNFEATFKNELADNESDRETHQQEILNSRSIAFQYGHWAYRCFAIGAAVIILTFLFGSLTAAFPNLEQHQAAQVQCTNCSVRIEPNEEHRSGL